mmetsp:Transcript_34820/g.75934  ORF Transcript_34820/g.75934 Transcript_34820/m.75934 type:complete len:302 (-) Transcript_34820:175-1080(-)
MADIGLDLGSTLANFHIYADDSKRTKFEKERLRTLVALHTSAKQELGACTGPQIGRQTMRETGSMFDRTTPRRHAESSSADVQKEVPRELEMDSEMPHEVLSIVGDPDLPILKQNGDRIGRLCARLRAFPEPVRMQGTGRPSSQGRPLTQGGSSGSGEIRVVARPPEEAVGGPRALASAEDAVARYMAAHVSFPALEALDKTVAEISEFETMREKFPRRHRHHPNLVRMTDYVLGSQHHFRRAMYGGGQDIPEFVPKEQRQLQAAPTRPRLLGMARGAGDGDSAVGGFRRDRSCPGLFRNH